MIQVIHRAIDILEYVSNDPERPKILGDIATDLNLNLSTCANIIKTLMNRAYLEKSDTQKGYLPGKKLVDLSGKTIYKQELIEASDEEMLKLSNKLKESVLLAVLKGDKRIVLHQHIYDNMIQVKNEEEKKAYDSSSGRLLISMKKDDFINKFVLKYGLPPANLWSDATTQRRMFAAVNKIREQGYAVFECTDQIMGVSAPVYKKAMPIAALSLYIPAFRVDDSQKEYIIKATIKAAKNISDRLSVDM